MPIDDLPSSPPEGMKRYRATYRDPRRNPFDSGCNEGTPVLTRTVDLDESIPLAQVEMWTKAAALQHRYVFVGLETLSS